VNSPHLSPALELDDAILALSGKLASLGVPSTMNSESDLSALAKALDSAISDLKLYEYYVLDTAHQKKELLDALSSSSTANEKWEGQNFFAGMSSGELASVLRAKDGAIAGIGKYAKRKGVKVELETALAFVEAAFGGKGKEEVVEEWGKILDVINVDLYREFDSDGKAQRDNVISRIRYERMEEGGPKMGEISAK
jgi:glycogen debranching enzyme